MQKQHLLTASTLLTASIQLLLLLAQAGPSHIQGGPKSLLLALMRAVVGSAYPSHMLSFSLICCAVLSCLLTMPSTIATVQAPASSIACCTYGLSLRR